MFYRFVYGTSEPLDLRLQLEPAPASLSGVTIEFDLMNRQREQVEPSLSIEWLDMDAQTVRITGLEALDPEHSPYWGRIKLTDVLGAVAFAPTGDEDPIVLMAVHP